VNRLSLVPLALLVSAVGCVPPGSAGEQDAGRPGTAAHPETRPAPTMIPSVGIMTAPFEDDFDRPNSPAAPATAEVHPALSGSVEGHPVPPATTGSAASSAGSAAASAGSAPSSVATATPPLPGADLGPDWLATQAGVWRIEGGRLCGEHAHNHGVWLKRVLPINARIEFDAATMSADGDLKAEYWGDGRSFATALSYTNATSYLTIFGGWHNKFHVLARLNEHGNDRKEITVTADTDDPREKPVVTGQHYHFKVERSDGRTVKWWVDGNEMLTWTDERPLEGQGHDHFGFNDWDVKVCFDNVKVVPLP
jgi:hypothetical protein